MASTFKLLESILHSSLLIIILLYHVSSVLSDTFTLFSTGEDLAYSDMYEHTRSSSECGTLCIRGRWDNVVGSKCQAYSYSTSDGTCQLYVEHTGVMDAFGIPVYKYYFLDENPVDGFDYVTYGGQTYIYYIWNTLMVFQVAKLYCEALGGYLLNLDSLDELHAVGMYLAMNEANGMLWIGANDIDNEGQWVTNRDNFPLDYAIWMFSIGEPNNLLGNEDCALYDTTTHGLYDGSCWAGYPAICERSP